MTLRSIRELAYICGFLLRTKGLRAQLNQLQETDPLESFRLSQKKIREATDRVFSISGSTVEVEGLENIPEGACLFAGNHLSFFDIIVVENAIPTGVGFVAKDSLGKIPGLTSWMSLMRCLLLDRGDMKEGLKTIMKGAEYLRSGYQMCIFPEGTRYPEGELGEFKPASLKMAQKAKVPVVPFAITGTSKIFEDNSFLGVKPAHVTISFAPPVLIHEMPRAEQRNAVEQVRGTVQEMIDRHLEQK